MTAVTRVTSYGIANPAGYVFRREALTVVCWHGSGRGVQVEAVPVAEMLKQAPQRRRRGQRRPAAPVAPQHDPRLQPGAHAAQRHRPAHLRAAGAYFPPAPPPRQRPVAAPHPRLAAPRRPWPGGSRATSRRRTRSRPAATAQGAPGRIAWSERTWYGLQPSAYFDCL